MIRYINIQETSNTFEENHVDIKWFFRRGRLLRGRNKKNVLKLATAVLIGIRLSCTGLKLNFKTLQKIEFILTRRGPILREELVIGGNVSFTGTCVYITGRIYN